MIVYVIVSIMYEGKKEPSFSVEPLGVYTELEQAIDYVNELDSNTVQDPSQFIETIYDILEFKLDERPLIIDWLKQEKQKYVDKIEESLIELMQDGYVDQLVGEDGHFYYTLTDAGKKVFKGIPKQIKKFFRKD